MFQEIFAHRLKILSLVYYLKQCVREEKEIHYSFLDNFFQETLLCCQKFWQLLPEFNQ